MNISFVVVMFALISFYFIIQLQPLASQRASEALMEYLVLMCIWLVTFHP